MSDQPALREVPKTKDQAVLSLFRRLGEIDTEKANLTEDAGLEIKTVALKYGLDEAGIKLAYRLYKMDQDKRRDQMETCGQVAGIMQMELF